MDFPILSLIDEEQAEAWLLNHFHPQGLHCPHCDASVEEAREFRKAETSCLQVDRCGVCMGGFSKPISIRLKACRQRSATFCVHFAVFIRSSSQDILLSVNFLSISSLSLLSLYQNSSNALNLNMSQLLMC